MAESCLDQWVELLVKVKVTGEGLLSSGCANVWLVAGGLDRLTANVISVLSNGLRHETYMNEVSARGAMWDFLQQLRWHDPVCSPDLDRCAKEPIAARAKAYIQLCLREHTISRRLLTLQRGGAVIQSYTEDAFLRQAEYFEALLICLRAVETNQKVLLADINPNLLNPTLLTECSITPDAKSTVQSTPVTPTASKPPLGGAELTSSPLISRSPSGYPGTALSAPTTPLSRYAPTLSSTPLPIPTTPTRNTTPQPIPGTHSPTPLPIPKAPSPTLSTTPLPIPGTHEAQPLDQLLPYRPVSKTAPSMGKIDVESQSPSMLSDLGMMSRAQLVRSLHAEYNDVLLEMGEVDQTSVSLPIFSGIFLGHDDPHAFQATGARRPSLPGGLRSECIVDPEVLIHGTPPSLDDFWRRKSDSKERSRRGGEKEIRRRKRKERKRAGDKGRNGRREVDKRGQLSASTASSFSESNEGWGSRSQSSSSLPSSTDEAAAYPAPDDPDEASPEEWVEEGFPHPRLLYSSQCPEHEASFSRTDSASYEQTMQGIPRAVSDGNGGVAMGNNGVAMSNDSVAVGGVFREQVCDSDEELEWSFKKPWDLYRTKDVDADSIGTLKPLETGPGGGAEDKPDSSKINAEVQENVQETLSSPAGENDRKIAETKAESGSQNAERRGGTSQNPAESFMQARHPSGGGARQSSSAAAAEVDQSKLKSDSAQTLRSKTASSDYPAIKHQRSKSDFGLGETSARVRGQIPTSLTHDDLTQHQWLSSSVQETSSGHRRGQLHRPAEGQSLISYLSSHDFHTCAELDRENAHFSICETLIAAIETMKWNQVLNPEPEEQEGDSDEEIQRLKQRIRIRRSERMQEKAQQLRAFSDGVTDTTETTGSGNSRIIDSDEGDFTDDYSEEEIDADLEEADAGSIDSNLQALKSSGLSLSMASLYSDQDLQKANERAQRSFQRQSSMEASQAGSAESIAISLLRNFNERELPKASELNWLVSEQEAPQTLLPLPSSISVPSEQTEGSVGQQSSRLRGNLQWAPPRQQIIFTLHPATKLQTSLEKQNYMCAGCGTKAIKGHLKRFKYCDYLGKYFCPCCHENEPMVVPARVLHHWDFRPQPVSHFAKQLLEKIYNEPLFNVDTINPSLYKKVKELHAVFTYRVQLHHLSAYIQTCRYANWELEAFKTCPAHWIEPAHHFSLADLTAIKQQQLMQRLDELVSIGLTHVQKCVLCQAKGFICEKCHSEDVLFPFLTQQVMQCVYCQACYHKRCFDSNNCPKCARLEQRRRRLQQTAEEQ